MVSLFYFRSLIMLNEKQKQALSFIRNYYNVNGKLPTVREVQGEFWYASPRSAQVIINALLNEGFLLRWKDKRLILWKTEETGMTIDIPLVGDVACGLPIFAEENIQAHYAVSTQIASPPYKYFFLRAKWDSMNLEGINHGDLILVREQNHANNGQIVVALINDEATIKEYQIHDDYIALIPHSDNEKHKTIILHEDFLIQWVFVKAFSSSIF